MNNAVRTAAVAWLVAVGVAAVVDTAAVFGRLVQVGLAVVAGIGTYLVLALMLAIEEVDDVMSALRRRFRG